MNQALKTEESVIPFSDGWWREQARIVGATSRQLAFARVMVEKPGAKFNKVAELSGITGTPRALVSFKEPRYSGVFCVWGMTTIGCDLNRSMQHLISNYREGDVENEAKTEDLLLRISKSLDVGSLAER